MLLRNTRYYCDFNLQTEVLRTTENKTSGNLATIFMNKPIVYHYMATSINYNMPQVTGRISSVHLI